MALEDLEAAGVDLGRVLGARNGHDCGFGCHDVGSKRDMVETKVGSVKTKD